MTPQPRHIEAAGRVTLEWYKNHVPAVSPEIRTLLVLDIARALAEAENRAAWDGWDLGILAKCTGEMQTKCLSVIVRAFGDEPVQLSAVRFCGRTVYVVGERGGDPVGFPADRVYEFDAERLEKLQSLHLSGDAPTLRREWEHMSLACAAN